MTAPTPQSGLEYLIVPDGNPPDQPVDTETIDYPDVTWSEPSFQWPDTEIGYFPPVGSPRALNGFRVGVRYFEEVITEEPIDGTGASGTGATGATGATGTGASGTGSGSGAVRYIIRRIYPAWTLIGQTLRLVSPSSDLYVTTTDYELYTAPPGNYNTDYVYSGINDGYSPQADPNQDGLETPNEDPPPPPTAYAYSKVFDQSIFKYIPPLSPPSQGEVDADPYLPEEPDEYPRDAVTKWFPDTRQEVTVSYTLTTTWTVGTADPETASGDTESIDISQVVFQTIDDWSAYCQAAVQRTYFTNGIYHQEIRDT